MQQIERISTLQVAIEAGMAGLQANIWTALPGIVSSYDAVKGTCVIQPAIQGIITTLSGVQYWVPIPQLSDVPVVYMGGGGFVATFPIQPGNEALVVFSSRCIDNWWASGKVSTQAELRMHDLSDGFAIIGPRSQANLIPNVSTDTVQLRSLDGSTYYELADGQVANIVAPGGINITGPLAVTGDVSITGKATATGEVQGNGIKLSSHTHSGVTAGGGTSGPPVP